MILELAGTLYSTIPFISDLVILAYNEPHGSTITIYVQDYPAG
jgi:hypothetical protein